MDLTARKFRVLSAIIFPIKVSSLNEFSVVVLMERSKSSSSMGREGGEVGGKAMWRRAKEKGEERKEEREESKATEKRMTRKGKD